jgi:Leucine-rich repeat (LRR) protein
MEDVLSNVFIFLPINDILACTNVCRIFHTSTTNQMLWKDLIKRYYGNTNIFKTNYYESYKFHHGIEIFIKNNSYYGGSITKTYNDRYIKLCKSSLYIPSILEQFSNLRTLDLGWQKLTFVPIGIEKLTNLSGLYLHDNSLETIPSRLGELQNLEILHLSDNKLITIPTEIGHLTKLKHLFLADNNLISLPTELGQLCNLELIGVSKNPNLTTLPVELSKIKNLKIIHDITMTIPPELKHMCK